MRCFVDVDGGHIRIRPFLSNQLAFSGKLGEPSTEEGLKEFFKEHQVFEVTCSSSCDFPHEYGYEPTPGNEVWEILERALLPHE